jgi:transposase
VTDANRYTPVINATYAEMATHYQTAVLPARPRKPKDKAKVEVAVQLVERWILARLRHQTFFCLAELNQAIAALLPDLNDRHFQGQSISRRDLYEQLDAPALKPLPCQPYEYAQWCKAKPGIDYHLSVQKRFYSVPHALVGQTLDVRLTAETVEVLHKGHRVAVHPRRGPLRFSTLVDHMPRAHRAHREWSPGRFLHWGQDIGPCTRQVVQQQLENRPHPEHGYRACLGLLNLSRRYSRVRLEKACERALAIRSINYQSIASILKQGLDRQSLEGDAHLQDDLPLHDNVRGADYYH